MATREALFGEIKNWWQKHDKNLDFLEIRAYLKQWEKAQESDGFGLRAPGRWKYFQHLIEFPQTYGEIMTSRQRAYSYVRVFAALFLGYHHLHVLDDVRVKRKRLFHGSGEKNGAARRLTCAAKPSCTHRRMPFEHFSVLVWTPCSSLAFS